MKERRQPDDLIDQLVSQVLESEAEGVDADSFLQRLKERGPRRRPVIRVPLRMMPVAAAAALLIALGAFLLLRPAEPEPIAGDGNGPLLALYRCGHALRDEVAAAWRGAVGAGTAVVSAGRAPVQELTDVQIPLPDLPDAPGLLLRDVPDQTRAGTPSTPEESER